MKNKSRLLWAALVFLLLCACGKATPAPAPDVPESEPEAPRVVSLICSDGELTLRFQRGEDDAWLWTDNPAFPLDGTCVDKLVESAQALDALSPLPEAEGPETYGLYDARKYVTLNSSDGSSVTYCFGDEAEDGGYYVNSDRDPARICLDSGALLEQIGRGIYAMVQLPQLPALTVDQIREVTLRRNDLTELYTVSEGKWRSGNRNVTDQPEIQALEALLATPVLTRCVDFAPSEGAAELCGLKPPAAVLQVTYSDGSYTLTVGALTEEDAVRFVTLNDDTTIYLMDAAPLAALIDGNE